MDNQFLHSLDGNPFNKIKSLLCTSHDSIVIFSPYISLAGIKALDIDLNKKVTLITTWKINDIINGASDISLYPYCKERDFKLHINNSIHLKIYLVDWKAAIFGSSNLSMNGLGLKEESNYELNMFKQAINTDTLSYLHFLLSESILVDDEVYSIYKENIKLHPKPQKIEEIELNLSPKFLISSLPMSSDIEKLYSLYSNDYINGSDEEINCAMHDIALYKIPKNFGYDEFVAILKKSFFNHAFIQKLLLFIDEDERYFGEMKAWIQENCTDVPVPSRRDLTGNIQVLYHWIIELSDGAYLSDRPNHSQRIYRVQ